VRIIQCMLAANSKLAEGENNKGDTPLHVGTRNHQDISKEVVRLFTEASPKVLLFQNNDRRIPVLLAMEKNISDEIIFHLAKCTIPTHGGNRRVPPTKWGMRRWQANIFFKWLQGTDSWDQVKTGLTNSRGVHTLMVMRSMMSR